MYRLLDFSAFTNHAVSRDSWSLVRRSVLRSCLVRQLLERSMKYSPPYKDRCIAETYQSSSKVSHLPRSFQLVDHHHSTQGTSHQSCGNISHSRATILHILTNSPTEQSQRTRTKRQPNRSSPSPMLKRIGKARVKELRSPRHNPLLHLIHM